MVSIHAPAKGATLSKIVVGSASRFQSTLPRRERLLWFPIQMILSVFQSTLPRRERRHIGDLKGLLPFVSIHAPAKGATPMTDQMYQTLLFQSTLPRRERRTSGIPATLVARVSIHAPAKGATANFRVWFSDCRVSIHAPAKGATIGKAFTGINTVSFNPRSREGSDLHGSHNMYHPHTVSIHAPAKGAT